MNNLKAYDIIFQGGTGEYFMKKSRFIATVEPAQTEEEALAIIEDVKKKYWDARHNCYAYVIGNTNPIMRFSDDGEPSQTAGKPMLDVLLSKELYNLVVVVTRYFGGTLLGTGGLVKSYQSATIEGLNNSKIITKEPGIRVKLTTDYTYVGKIQHLIGQASIPVINSEFTDIVTINLIIGQDKIEDFIDKVTDLTSGHANIDKIKETYFATSDNKVHLF